MNKTDILQNYIAATNTHDFNNVKKCISPQAIYYFSDATCTTSKEIEDYFIKAWNTVKNEVYVAKDIQWLIDTNDTLVCLYTFIWKGYIDGIYNEGEGRATNVFHQENGTWLLIHEHLG